MTYQKILVAIDGSERSEKGFQKAIKIAKESQSELFLVHVVDTWNYSSVLLYNQALLETLELSDYEKTAREAGVKEVKTSLEYGTPQGTIAGRVAKQYHPDLIVCGATGRNPLKRIFIGSVAEYIVKLAACDVMVVR